MIEQNTEIEPILNYVTSNYSQIIRHKGNSLAKRLLRPFWELYRTITAMFIEAPFMSMLIIGLPASVLSIVCYCLCCLPNETLMNDADILYDKRTIGENNEEEDTCDIPTGSDHKQKTTIEKKED
jgi:hypothetical protein